MIALLLAFACAAAAADAPPATTSLPEELSALEELAGDETRLVQAVRDYDVQQEGLAAWDRSLAQELSMTGHPDLAQDKVQKALERDRLVRAAWEAVLARYPKNPRAMTYYAETLYDRFGHEAGNEAKALQLWHEAIELDPTLHEAMNNLAIHYDHIGQTDRALEFLDKALELKPDHPDYLYNVAQLYLIHWPAVERKYNMSTRQVIDKALEHSKKAAELRPDSYPLVSDYALNFYRAQQLNLPVDWEEAAKAWQNTRTVARDDVELFSAWLNEGIAWVNAGKPKKAEKPLEEALKINPGSDRARRYLAQAREGRSAN